MNPGSIRSRDTFYNGLSINIKVKIMLIPMRTIRSTMPGLVKKQLRYTPIL